MKNQNIKKKGQSSMTPNNLYVNMVPMSDIFSITIRIKEKETRIKITLNAIIAAIGVIIMIQIRISLKDQGVEYIDKLPSYSSYKKNIILALPGKTLAVLVGLVKTLPYMGIDKMTEEQVMNHIVEFIETYSGMSIPNSRRTALPTSLKDIDPYMRGEISSGWGQLLSCPATNIKMLNLNADKIKEADLSDALSQVGITEEVLKNSELTIDKIKLEFQSRLLEDKGGFPKQSITFDENPEASSKIEKEIMGEKLIRNGKISVALDKGQEPASAITRKQIEKALNPFELLQYNVALRSGDANILRKYTNMAVERINKNSNDGKNPVKDIKSGAFESSTEIKTVETKTPVPVIVSKTKSKGPKVKKYKTPIQNMVINLDTRELNPIAEEETSQEMESITPSEQLVAQEPTEE